ncbi:MAG: tail fiber protein [Spirochaetales bacterium]|nr:tail fiber protein [Spirochaetales bacterium]
MENNKRTSGILNGISKKTAIIGFTLLLFLGGIIIFSDITKPYTFKDGDIISASQVNENFNRLYAKVNELEDIVNPGGGVALPAGTIMPFGGTSDKVPEGWLLCDGTAYAVSEYSELYNVIGTNFGSVNAGIFNVPDLRGMFLCGADNGKGEDPDSGSRTALQDGGNTGDNVGSRQGYMIQNHSHYMIYSYEDGGNGTHINGEDGNNGNIDTSVYGGNETRPENVYVNFIIKY